MLCQQTAATRVKKRFNLDERSETIGLSILFTLEMDLDRS